jgi:hypothetical protein
MSSDILYEELESKLMTLCSDRKVAELVDLCSLVQSTGKSQFIAHSALRACKCMHRDNMLYLLKFVSLYAKKDLIFFKFIENFLTSICLSCYRLTSQRDTLELYIAGWQMRTAPWPSIASRVQNSLTLLKHGDTIKSIALDLDFPVKFKRALAEPSLDEAIRLGEERLDRVIEAVNILAVVRDPKIS